MNRTPIVGLRKFRFDNRRGHARQTACHAQTDRGKMDHTYRSGGEEAVMGGNGGRRYDWETKVAAARDHVENGMTKTEVMAKYAIASVSVQ